MFGRTNVRSSRLSLLVGVPVAIGLLGGPGAAARASSCPWMNASRSSDARAEMLLGAMTLADKIAMVHQSYPQDSHYGAAGWIPANTSLCIPDLTLNDAGEGVGDQQVGATAFPAPIAQAASWDTSLQYQLGAALGQEAAGKGPRVSSRGSRVSV